MTRPPLSISAPREKGVVPWSQFRANFLQWQVNKLRRDSLVADLTMAMMRNSASGWYEIVERHAEEKMMAHTAQKRIPAAIAAGDLPEFMLAHPGGSSCISVAVQRDHYSHRLCPRNRAPLLSAGIICSFATGNVVRTVRCLASRGRSKNAAARKAEPPAKWGTLFRDSRRHVGCVIIGSDMR